MMNNTFGTIKRFYFPKTSGNAGGTICTRISQQRKKSKQDKEVTKHKKHTL